VTRLLAPGLLALFLVLGLAACGKKNTPQPPPGAPVTYPRSYPSA
jgi:predicted small lipoprotein YifL